MARKTKTAKRRTPKKTKAPVFGSWTADTTVDYSPPDYDTTWRIVSLNDETVTLTGPGKCESIMVVTIDDFRNTWRRTADIKRWDAPKSSITKTPAEGRVEMGRDLTLPGYVLTTICDVCGKVHVVDFGEEGFPDYPEGNKPFEFEVSCTPDRAPPPVPTFKLGDLVRVKSFSDRPAFKVTSLDRGLVGSAPWWPDALWAPEQVEHVDPLKGPKPHCTNKWTVKLQIDVSVRIVE